MAHHHHHHDHGHGHSRDRNRSRLTWTLVLTLLYMLAEAVGGWLAHSLALLADAGHMFSDAAALGLSLFAIWIAQRPPTPQHSYGYYRAEILAALVNGAGLVVIAILVFIEAAHRLNAPEEVNAKVLVGIAAGGLVVNLAGLALLNAGKRDSLNVHGAWLHLLTDALGSVAALAAGAAIWAFRWYWADPAASIVIGVLVIYSSWGLLKDAIAILMESTPSHLDIDAVRTALFAAPGVREVHDLHIWTITSGMDSLSAHVVLGDGASPQATQQRIRDILHDQFGINHVTIQIESDAEGECRSVF